MVALNFLIFYVEGEKVNLWEVCAMQSDVHVAAAQRREGLRVQVVVETSVEEEPCDGIERAVLPL